MTDIALVRLAQVDPVMRRLIAEIGPCTLKPDSRRQPFEALVCAVAHQQLNGTAANTILKRFRALFPGKRFPAAGDLAAVHDDAMRAAGFSRAKIASIRDIAGKTLTGLVPARRQVARLDDEEIVARLTEVRGVGRWTVEMLLIFTLGRPDILPADDFGVRNGFRIAYSRNHLPAPKAILKHGEIWRPHRTIAAWYLWRAADRARAALGPKGW